MFPKAPNHRVRLPAEVLLQIFDSLVPSSPIPIALPASDPITKTLLSLTLTSQEFNPIALRYLYTHCLYIDSIPRLRTLVPTLRLFQQRNAETPLDQSFILTHIKSCYFKFRTPHTHRRMSGPDYTVSDHRTFIDLLALLKPSLQRLLIDIPTKDCISFYFNEPSFLEEIIIAISSLQELELYCSTSDFLCPTQDGINGINMVTAWPKLHVVGVVFMHQGGKYFWETVAHMKCIKTVILMEQDSKRWQRWKPFGIPENVFGVGSHREMSALCVSLNEDHEAFSDVRRVENNVRVRELQFPLISHGVGSDRESLQWIVNWTLRGDERSAESRKVRTE